MTLLDKTLDTSLVSIEKAMFQVSVLYKWKVMCARKCLQGNKDTSGHNRPTLPGSVYKEVKTLHLKTEKRAKPVLPGISFSSLPEQRREPNGIYIFFLLTANLTVCFSLLLFTGELE